MENIKLNSIDEVDDISSIDNYKVALAAGVSEKEALHMIELYGRDNARTPFQWNASENAGFTTGTPWLRVNPNYTQINLAAQKDDPDSIFQYYRALSRLRKDPAYQETLVYGAFIPYLEDHHNVMAYLRRTDDQTILVIANYQRQPQTLPLPGKVNRILLANTGNVSIQNGQIDLEGYQAVVLELGNVIQ